MDERLQFVARRLAGVGGTLQRIWNLSQDRLQDFRSLPGCGIQGLTGRSHRPYRYAHRLPCKVRTIF